MTLRPYQSTAIQSLYQYWQNTSTGNGVIVAPTGSGKSVIMAELIRDISTKWPGTRILVLTHVRELIEQDYGELKAMWPDAPAGIYSAGLKRKESHQSIIFAGIQSIAGHCQKLDPPPEIVLVDECHLIPRHDTTRYKTTLATLKQMYSRLRVVGLSATPYRLDSGWLHRGDDAIFDQIVFDIPIQQLIDDGFLSPLVSKSGCTSINTDGIKHIGREFASGELEDAAMAGDTTNQAVADMVARASDRHKWLVFACGLKHAAQIKAALDGHGIESGIITGDTPSSERTDVIASFKGQRLNTLRCIINVNVLTTGFNVPELDLIAMMRPTESASLYVQMAGRGMRKAPGKADCLILDYAGNCLRHGPVDAVNPDRRTGSGDGVAPAKECPQCNCIIHAAAKTCPYCGFVFPPVAVEIRHVPTEAPVLKKEVAPECLEVDSTKYELWEKPDKKPSVKITYNIGNLDRVSEWVFPESGNQAGAFYYGKFCSSLGLDYPYPKTAKEFLDLPLDWMQAAKIWTVPDGKYTRVVKREYRDAIKYDDVVPF